MERKQGESLTTRTSVKSGQVVYSHEVDEEVVVSDHKQKRPRSHFLFEDPKAEKHQDIDVDGPKGHVGGTIQTSVGQGGKIDAGVALTDEKCQ